MFRLIDFACLCLFVGFVLPAGIPWAISAIHERLDPAGVAYEVALQKNQALSQTAHYQYVSMYLASVHETSPRSLSSDVPGFDEVP